VDEHDKPRVIVSVLMLREGFDVNNICVIVPLRVSSAPILLEQTIGRGLRLMWREPEFQDLKDENRRQLLSQKREPRNYLDLLLIVEHPAFMQFYDDLLKEGLLGEIETDPGGREGVLGDIITAGLKPDYKKYDFFWPSIIREAEEELKSGDTMLQKLDPFTAFRLDDLQNLVAKEGEKFFSEEITVKTRFGSIHLKRDTLWHQSLSAMA
jgi:type III restriction enzyme